MITTIYSFSGFFQAYVKQGFFARLSRSTHNVHIPKAGRLFDPIVGRKGQSEVHNWNCFRACRYGWTLGCPFLIFTITQMEADIVSTYVYKQITINRKSQRASYAYLGW